METSKNGVAVYPQGKHPRDVRKDQEAKEPKVETQSGVVDTSTKSAVEKPAKAKK